jgi:NADH-quinone oxidoreductase subunit J
MSLSFAIIAAVTIAAAVAAISLRNLVHCALSLAVVFGGIAVAYLQLGAQFAGFAQILVYIGAVAILIVFAILLTRSSEPDEQPVLSRGWAAGVAVAVAVLGVLTYAISRSPMVERVSAPQPPDAAVRQIGEALMTKYVLPLEVIGLLLTAALIGAVIIAMQERKEAEK